MLPLPEDLRAGATVVTYDPETGARKVLRQGTNTLECEPRNPGDGFIRCYSNLMAPRHELEAKLRAQKKSDKEIQEGVDDAIKAGTLKVASIRDDVLPVGDQGGRDQALMGDVRALRDAGIDRRIHHQPARRRTEGSRSAVADACGYCERTRDDPDRRIAALDF